MYSDKPQIIPIYFTFNRYYVLAAAVCFYSLLRHADRRYHYALYVVHTDLSAKHQTRLKQVVSAYNNAQLHFIDASSIITAWDGLRNKSHFSKEIFYKLTAPDLFPQYDRILFSDVDVVFTRDCSPAYFMFEDDNFYFAGTRPLLENTNLPRYNADFSSDEIQLISDYEISAGFMLLNLKAMRQDNAQQQLTSYFHSNIHRLILPEQDCIALCCPQKIRFLPYEYVVCHNQIDLPTQSLSFNPNNPELFPHDRGVKHFRHMVSNMIQLHYPGPNKPWNSRNVPHRGTWVQYCKQAGQYAYYLSLQPLFIKQRLQRYSVKRFLSKCIKKIRG